MHLDFFSSIAPGEPGSVELTVISATQLNLSWASPSDPNGIITGYRVIWRMVKDVDDNPVNDNDSAKTKIISNGDAVFFLIEDLGKHRDANGAA